MSAISRRASFPPLAAVLCCLLGTAGCNWVDSTGLQSSTITPAVVGTQPAGLDSSQIRAVTINEESETEIVPGIGASAVDSDWHWGAPYQSGALPVCNAIEGFDSSLAVPTLQDACTDSEACDVSFDFFRTEDDEVRFKVALPALRASTGLAYVLSATDAQGNTVNEYLTLCAISINEAPVAQDDIFDVDPFLETRISAADQIHLLSNDYDDIDVQNQPLRVDTVAVTEPGLAQQFILHADGGFVYQPRQDLVATEDLPLFDSFVYALQDGQHTSTASVTLRIRSAETANSPPSIHAIGDVFVSTGESFAIGISAQDADLDPLIFSLSEETPDFVQIDPLNGEISGSSDVAGSFIVTVIASDGQDQSSASFIVFVQAEANRPPYADDIQNKTVSGKFRYDVSGFFGDPNGDPLLFTATGMPPGTRISSSGVITGTATQANLGRHLIRVYVDDGRGGTASDGFRLTIVP